MVQSRNGKVWHSEGEVKSGAVRHCTAKVGSSPAPFSEGGEALWSAKAQFCYDEQGHRIGLFRHATFSNAKVKL